MPEPVSLRIDDDDFALLGLQRRFAQPTGEIDARWKALQAQVHPDRFAHEGPAAQRVAMQWSVRVNEAHRRLRDPLQRASRLCELAGADPTAPGTTAMPPQFLQQQMAWREALEEAASPAEARALDVEVRQQEQSMMEQLQQALDERGDVQAAAALVRALMFIRRLRDDLDQRLDALPN